MSCESIEEKDSRWVVLLEPKKDAIDDSEVAPKAGNRLELADIEDENDRETGRVPGGDGPPNIVDEYMSNPLAFGESGWGSGCGGATGGIGKLITGAACTCRKYVVKKTGRSARYVNEVRVKLGCG
jgi:hypothetical protein